MLSWERLTLSFQIQDFLLTLIHLCLYLEIGIMVFWGVAHANIPSKMTKRLGETWTKILQNQTFYCGKPFLQVKMITFGYPFYDKHSSHVEQVVQILEYYCVTYSLTFYLINSYVALCKAFTCTATILLDVAPSKVGIALIIMLERLGFCR